MGAGLTTGILCCHALSVPLVLGKGAVALLLLMPPDQSGAQACWQCQQQAHTTLSRNCKGQLITHFDTLSRGVPAELSGTFASQGKELSRLFFTRRMRPLGMFSVTLK